MAVAESTAAVAEVLGREQMSFLLSSPGHGMCLVTLPHHCHRQQRHFLLSNWDRELSYVS